MEAKTISVIIPVFNQLEYFKKCIDSVCNQTYKNLQIICVDDGSTDGVEVYLDEIAQKDSRIIVIHQDNAGESHARNVGLQQAIGEYIAFVDCDDWIEPDMYQTMIEMAQKDNLDMVATSWFKDIEGGQSIQILNEKQVSTEIIDRDELLKYIYMRDSYRGFAYMWNKLYKRNVLHAENGLQEFDEKIRLGGDVIYLAQAALATVRAKYLDKAYYHYRIRKGSGSHTTDLSKMKDWIKSYEITIGLLEDKKVEKNTIDYVKRFMAYHAMEAVEICNEIQDSDYKDYFVKVMRENADTYIRLNNEYPKRIEQYKKLAGI